jgi:[acyl-carrier-protein] S-malonyltransferase
MSVALLFSPQGSQAVGMGRDLAAAIPGAHAVYEAADRALGWSVSETCFAGPEDRLNDTRQTQPCLVATSLAALAALRSRVEIIPSYVAGHSVGEYAALVAAGVLGMEDALRLVARRGALMAEEAIDGGMTAVIGLAREVVTATIEAVASPVDLVVANDNAPGQIVISGTRQALSAAETALRAAGAKRLIPLKVSGPFHSPHMASVSDGLATAFDEVSWHDADPPVVSNVSAAPERDVTRLRNLLSEQVRSSVEWVASVERMVADGVDTFVECGPGSALAGMVRRIAPGARTLGVSDVTTLDATARALAGEPAGATA